MLAIRVAVRAAGEADLDAVCDIANRPRASPMHHEGSIWQPSMTRPAEQNPRDLANRRGSGEESGLRACYGKTLHLQGFPIDGLERRASPVHHAQGLEQTRSGSRIVQKVHEFAVPLIVV
jgi:hypothetical protein